MKAAHISDLHWRGIARHDEYTRAFTLLFSELRKENVDCIINTGDTFHTKTQGITPEIIERLAWLFNELAKIAPTYSILGNHDLNLSNSSRLNIIKTVHDAIANPNAILLENSMNHVIDKFNISLNNYSCVDMDKWDSVLPSPNRINIALYHGSISGVKVNDSSTWRLWDGEKEVDFFKEHDFAFLGDIHKHQFLSYRKDKDGNEKPWIAYPGSLIQQNYGESTKKGYLIWTIRDKDDWDVEWKQLENMSPFLTIPWKGSAKETIDYISEQYGHLITGTRYRISSSVTIPQMQARQIVQELKDEFFASEVVFKTDLVNKIDSFTSGGIKIHKKSLARDPETVYRLYKDYVTANQGLHSIDKPGMDIAKNVIDGYFSKLMKDADVTNARNVTWTIQEFKFDNLFGYGEGNYINFEDLDNLVGIFGSNRVGKSSIIGGIMYTLYNTTDRGPIKTAHIINRNKDYCFGQIHLNVGGTDYIVERKSERSKYVADGSNTSVNLWKLEKFRDEKGHVLSKKTSMNGITRDQTDEIIKNLIGTSEDFLLTAFASQGNINRFIDNKATKRKEILNRFLELDIFEKLYLFAKDDYNNIDSDSKKYSIVEWSKLIDKSQKDVQKYQEEIDKINEKIAPLQNKRDELKIWLNTNQKEADSVDSKSIKNIQIHISNLEKNLKNITEAIKDNKTQLSKAKFTKRLLESKLRKIDRDLLKSKLEEYEQVKNSIHELKLGLDKESNELENQEQSIRKLNVIPCGDSFPGCHFIRDAHQAKDTISQQKKMVSEITKKYENLQKIFDNYTKLSIQSKIEEFDSQKLELTVTNSNIENLELSISHDTINTKSIASDIRSSKAKLAKAKKTFALLESCGYTKKKNKLEKTEALINEYTEKRNELLVKLGGKKESLEKLLQEQASGSDLVKKLRIFESIQSAFSKNGIPAMVLKTQLPSINAELAKVLNGLVDFSVSLETDLDSNNMDVYVIDSKGKRLVELCSGMEKTITSMAMRVALGNLSALSRPDILILDESFGALDEHNLLKGMELLTLFRNYYKTIFVISHIPQIKETADQIIEIKFDGVESKVIA